MVKSLKNDSSKILGIFFWKFATRQHINFLLSETKIIFVSYLTSSDINSDNPVILTYGNKK